MMNKNRPLLDISVKEFIHFFKFGLGKGGQLTYRINWLKKKIEELGLKIKIYKSPGGRYYADIHEMYLIGRSLVNPLLKDTFGDIGNNYLVRKDKYNEEDYRNENIKRLKNKGGKITYRLSSDIKGFIFYLIKKYYDGKETKRI